MVAVGDGSPGRTRPNAATPDPVITIAPLPVITWGGGFRRSTLIRTHCQPSEAASFSARRQTRGDDVRVVCIW